MEINMTSIIRKLSDMDVHPLTCKAEHPDQIYAGNQFR